MWYGECPVFKKISGFELNSVLSVDIFAYNNMKPMQRYRMNF